VKCLASGRIKGGSSSLTLPPSLALSLSFSRACVSVLHSCCIRCSCEYASRACAWLLLRLPFYYPLPPLASALPPCRTTHVLVVPLFVLGNSADQLVPASHQRDVFEAYSSKEKDIYWVRGATHYYTGPGQLLKLAEATEECLKWLSKIGLLQP
jgi:hypothetical protein